jgi:hypothetical protein
MLAREESEESDEEESDESVVRSGDCEDELEDVESNVSMEELVMALLLLPGAGQTVS